MVSVVLCCVCAPLAISEPAVDTPPPPRIHAWRIPSSKREHARTSGGTNRHTHSALMPPPPRPNSEYWSGSGGSGVRATDEESLSPRAETP